MTDKKISELNELSTPVNDDEIAIVDKSVPETKKLTWANLKATVKSYYDSVTTTLTNKTIDGDNNTISNLDLGNEVDWAAADNVTDRTAFASGDKLVIYEAGVGFRKIDYNDLPVATRDSLGLDTDDSPQFIGIELGNASDTTLTRSAAGKLAVEGNNVAILDTDTVEITVANWNSGTTVNKTVSGITATNIVWVSPAPASYDKFVEFEIKATGQDTNEITFGASSTPDATINVNVVFEK